MFALGSVLFSDPLLKSIYADKIPSAPRAYQMPFKSFVPECVVFTLARFLAPMQPTCSSHIWFDCLYPALTLNIYTHPQLNIYVSYTNKISVCSLYRLTQQYIIYYLLSLIYYLYPHSSMSLQVQIVIQIVIHYIY